MLLQRPTVIPQSSYAAASSSEKAGDGSGSDNDSDNLLSEYTSETSFFNGAVSRVPSATKFNDPWKFNCYRSEGKVNIFCEWTSKSRTYRLLVIGPEWYYITITCVVITVPSALALVYLIRNDIEKLLFIIVMSLSLTSLFLVSTTDPGLSRIHHHARSRKWTYWLVLMLSLLLLW